MQVGIAQRKQVLTENYSRDLFRAETPQLDGKLAEKKFFIYITFDTNADDPP